MPLEYHPLSREFPDQQNTLRSLLQSNPHFSRLAEDYQTLDKRIYEVEDGLANLDDLALQELKLQRVLLKDEIAGLLKSAGS